MTWIVGREGTCYVEEAEPLRSGGVLAAEVPFRTEIEAVRFAITCEEEARDPITRNLRNLRARLKKLSERPA